MSNQNSANLVSVKNPFATSESVNPDGIMNTKSQREVMEVQAMVIMAKQFPRNQIQAVDRILNACTRPSLAEGAVYSYPRGGNNVEGPSIRLAEVIAQNWGNIDFGIRELSQTKSDSIVEAYAWDLETNTRQVKVFQVPHKRFTKQGVKILSDSRDIYELVATIGARRLRACILGVIPGDVIEQAVKQCSITLASTVDVTDDGIKAMVQAFESFGITKEMIEMRCQCRIEAIRPAQYIKLRKIYASLQDGMSKPHDWFDIPEQDTAHRSELNDLLTKQSSKEGKEDVSQ